MANTNPTTVSTAYATAYPYSSDGDTEPNNRINFKNNFTNIRYGDAIIETGTMASTAGAWHLDYSFYPFANGTFFKYGGYYSSGSDAGIFAFGSSYGDANSGVGYRTVLCIL